MFLFAVTRRWKMNSLLVIVYLLLAFFATVQTTEFEHHISLNSESVYTPAVYDVKRSCDVCVIENNARGVDSHLTWEMA